MHLTEDHDRPSPTRFFPSLVEAFFIRRPNRFLVHCRRGDQELCAHLPNPGRLHELLLPNARLLLVPEKRTSSRTYPYTVAAVEKAGRLIMLHTLRTNTVARALLEHGAICALRGSRIVRSEVQCGSSRFDFLLEEKGKELFLEVKSCTLMGEHAAMFPDAVTQRGTRHLLELARLKEEGKKVAVLFLVHSSHVRIFMPDYHTDLVFAQTLLRLRRQIRIIPVAIHWEEDLSLRLETRALRIPWSLLEREVEDRGSYLLLLHLEKHQVLTIGRLGEISFPAGYYVYVGSAMANLSQRLSRHQRGTTTFHWHIDYLRGASRVHAVLPVRASTRLECLLAHAVSTLSEESIPEFGSSDCTCASHLFRFSRDPLLLPAFHDMLLHYRMDRLRS